VDVLRLERERRELADLRLVEGLAVRKVAGRDRAPGLRHVGLAHEVEQPAVGRQHRLRDDLRRLRAQGALLRRRRARRKGAEGPVERRAGGIRDGGHRRQRQVAPREHDLRHREAGADAFPQQLDVLVEEARDVSQAGEVAVVVGAVQQRLVVGRSASGP
jgi:hypothetical protein